MTKINVDQLLLIGSFIGVAYSPFYVAVFIAIAVKHLVVELKNQVEQRNTQQELKKELEKVQAVSAQIEELQNSINNIRAAVSLGNRR